MRPRNRANYPFVESDEEPSVQLATPPRSSVRPADDGRATLIAELDRLRARADALVMTAQLADRLEPDRAAQVRDAIAAIRTSIDEGTERIATALGVEPIPPSRRRVAG